MKIPLTCNSCGEPLTNQFCSMCGEKKLTSKDISLAPLINDVVDDLFQINKKTWPTILQLLLRPGSLVLSYINGVRVKYYSPIKIFFVINILFYVILPNVTVFYSSPDSMINGYHGAWVNNIFHYDLENAIEEKRKETGNSVNIIRNELVQTASDFSKQSVILLVPFLAMVIYLINSKREYYLKAYVCALHFFSVFMLLATFLLFPFILSNNEISRPIQYSFYILLCVYVILSVKRSYSLSFPKSLYKGGITMAAMYSLIIIYKQFIVIIALRIYPFQSMSEYLYKHVK